MSPAAERIDGRREGFERRVGLSKRRPKVDRFEYASVVAQQHPHEPECTQPVHGVGSRKEKDCACHTLALSIGTTGKQHVKPNGREHRRPRKAATVRRETRHEIGVSSPRDGPPEPRLRTASYFDRHFVWIRRHQARGRSEAEAVQRLVVGEIESVRQHEVRVTTDPLRRERDGTPVVPALG